MRRLIASVLVGLAIVLQGGMGGCARLKWQPADVVVEGSSLNNPDEAGGVAIYSPDGSIIVVTGHEVEVSVFTILGQLVCKDSVKPGTSILNINSRGIYIVKIANVTQKVAL